MRGDDKEEDNKRSTIGGVEIPIVDKFKYLRSIIQEKGDIDGGINQQAKGGWQKWKYASRVLCCKSVRIDDPKVWITSGGPHPPYHPTS